MVAGVMTMPVQLSAQVNSWTGGASGKWENGANWNAGAPSSSQSIFVTNANTKTVTVDATTAGTFPGTMTINNLTVAGVGAGVNTLSLNNAGLVTPLQVNDNLNLKHGGAILINNSVLRVVNFSDYGTIDGQVQLLSGSLQADRLALGSVTGETGTISVSGGSATFSSWLSAGDDVGATGVVWVTGGQLVVTNHSTWIGYFGIGEMTFFNSTWLAQQVFVGQNPGAQGTLTLVNATNLVSSLFSIAESPGSSGAVWMNGGKLVITNAQIEVGSSGSGQMTVSNGTVLARRIFVAASTGSAGTLTVAGGVVNLSSNMVIGSTSTGSVVAAGMVWMKGGQLIAINSTIDVGLDGVGMMIVSNGTVLARDVNVNASSLGSLTGSAAQGNLSVLGGSFTAFSSLVIGDCATGGGTGTVRVAGGNLAVTNSTGSAVLDVRSGTLILDAGVLTIDRLIMTDPCSRIVWNGGSLSVGIEMLDPLLDADADGLPNSWEQQFGLDPLSALGTDGPNGNPDGDELTNLQEYLAGTNPNNGASALRVTAIAREGADIRVTWSVVGGKTYVLQFMPINQNGYTNLFTDFSPSIFVPLGAPATTNYLDVGAAASSTSRYYRVRLQIP